MDDELTRQLSTIVLSLENVFGLNEENAIGLKISQADINVALEHARAKYSRLSDAARSSFSKKIIRLLDSLYKVTAICIFKGVKRLNYADYANLEAMRDTLMMYTVETNITQKTISYCNIIAEILSDIDETKPNYKNSLSYKYLRMFVFLVIVGNYVAASCVATFILTQIGE